MEQTRGGRRRYSAELKQRILAECARPGASVAGVALAHRINANIVHRWRQRVRDDEGGVKTAKDTFIPLTLAAPAAAPLAVIRIEVRRGAAAVLIQWPAACAAECAVWLREWLK